VGWDRIRYKLSWRMKRVRGMKGHVDKWRGMKTLISEDFKIKPTDPSRVGKQTTRSIVSNAFFKIIWQKKWFCRRSSVMSYTPSVLSYTRRYRLTYQAYVSFAEVDRVPPKMIKMLECHNFRIPLVHW
jgi:hypothetical protein